MSELRSISRRDALRITAGVGVGAAFGTGLGIELLRQAGLRRVRETRTQMGTLVTLTVGHPDGDEATAMVDRAFAEMERLEAIFSRYRADSAVGRLNEAGRLVGAPRELVDVLTLAHDMSRRSGGAFDVTVGPLVELYRASFERHALPPSDCDVRGVLDYVNYQGVTIDGDVIRLADERMKISLDGMAKGFIVDRAVARMTDDGAERVLVDAGGDMTSGGSGVVNDPWTIGIQDSRASEELVGRLQLDGAGVATSGDYLRNFTPDRRHHDIIDPRTGRSPEQLSSSTVLARTAVEADALSTALLVLSPEAGLALIDAYGEAECLLIPKEGGVQIRSRGMSSRLG